MFFKPESPMPAWTYTVRESSGFGGSTCRFPKTSGLLLGFHGADSATSGLTSSIRGISFVGRLGRCSAATEPIASSVIEPVKRYVNSTESSIPPERMGDYKNVGGRRQEIGSTAG